MVVEILGQHDRSLAEFPERIVERLLADDHSTVGVVRDVGDLGRSEPDVHRDHDGVELQRGHGDLAPLGPIRHQETDTFAGPDTELGEPAGERVGATIEVEPGEVLSLESQPDLVGPDRGPVPPDVRQVDHRRPPFLWP